MPESSRYGCVQCGTTPDQELPVKRYIEVLGVKLVEETRLHNINRCPKYDEEGSTNNNCHLVHASLALDDIKSYDKLMLLLVSYLVNKLAVSENGYEEVANGNL